MPPRRSHRKSRAGCRRCKSRKIKCDEVHPRCGNCVKHGVPCDFESRDVLDDLAPPLSIASSTSTSTTAPSTANNSATASVAPSVSTSITSTAESPRGSTTASLNVPRTPSLQPSPGPAPTPTPAPIPAPAPAHVPRTPLTAQAPFTATSSSAGQVDRLLELRLMHQYITITSKTLLTKSPVAEDVWQKTVPQTAFQGRPYLVDAMLSVAALHLRSQNPEDKTLVRASHAYAASTFSEYCAALNNGITPENAEALFLTAALISFQSAASRIFTKDDAEADSGGASSRYTLPTAWFHAFQGVKTVTASAWRWIFNNPRVNAVIDTQPGFTLNLNPLGLTSFFGHLLEGVEEELSTEDPIYLSSTGQAYSHAICVLNYAHKNLYPAAALAFPVTVSRRFIELMEEKRPRALAILACFFALLKRMDNVWWLHDVSRREVMGLVSMFEPGSKWWQHLEWPVRIALLDGPITSEVWGTEWDMTTERDNGSVDTMVSHLELMSELVTQAHNVGVPASTHDAELPLALDSPD
jgi:hypothetical protein